MARSVFQDDEFQVGVGGGIVFIIFLLVLGFIRSLLP